MCGNRRMCCLSVLCFFALLCCTLLIYWTEAANNSLKTNEISLDKRILNYENLRADLVEREQYAQVGGKVALTPQEQRLNAHLMAVKQREFDIGLRSPREFKPTQHFFQVYEQIAQTPLFQLLKTMPKGGVLHAHDTALCSTDYLLQLTYRTHLWLCVNLLDDTYESLLFSRMKPAKLQHVNCDWLLLQELRHNVGSLLVDRKLRESLTLYPREKFSDTNDVWLSFIGIFRLVTGMLIYKPVWFDYMYRALEEFHNDGVQYLEIRSTLPTLYDLDGGNYTVIDTARVMRDAAEMFKLNHTEFLGAKVIYAPSRRVNDSVFDKYLLDAVKLKQELPDYFAGFDLVSQEDEGRPLRDFAHKLIAMQNEIDYYFHAGETNWYGTSTDENLIDALLLGTKRIGHGYALPKHPVVMQLLRAADVAVELSPISNQILQHVLDFRNHPGAFLLAAGYPVVVASDDPSFWKSTPLTHDFYITFMGIASQHADLTLLKQLARNSLYYSALDDESKNKALHRWSQMWHKWIDQSLSV